MNPEPSNGFASGQRLSALFRLMAHPALRYAFAVLLVGLACLLRFALAHALGSQYPFVTFYPAVMLVALLCGLGPGLLATALSALYIAVFVFAPVGQFAISGTPDAIALALFGCLGTFMSMIAGLYNRASAKVAAYEQEQARLAGRQPSVAPAAIFHLPEATRSFKKRLAFDAALALALAILFSVGWLAYRDMTAAAEADRWVNHSHLVIEEIDGLLASLNTAESGERGFIITGDQKYLNPYDASLSEIEAHLASLRTLTADNPHQQQRLAGINPLVAAKLAQLKDTIALRETKGLQAASDAVLNHLGSNIMASLRPLLDAARHEEEQLLQVRVAAKEENTRDTIRSVFLGGSLSAIALVLLFASLKLELAGRRRAETELRQHRDHLENLVVERTRDLEGEVTERKHFAEALFESRARLAVALTSAGMASFEWDMLKDKRTWDDSLHELFGTSPDTFSGTTEEFFGMIHAEDRASVQSALARAAGTNAYETEYRVVLPDGGIRNIASRGKVHRDDTDRAVRLLGVCWDITENKTKENALRQLNRTLKALGASSQAMNRVAREQEYLEEVCRIVVHDCGHAMVWIGLADQDEDKTVRPIAHAGFDQGYLETLKITWSADDDNGSGPTGTAIRTGRPCACRHMLTDPAFAPWREQALKRGFASSLALPLMAGGSAFGALTLYSREPDPFSDDEVKLLTQLADDLAFGITTLRVRLDLARSEERYRTLFDTMIEGFCIIEVIFDPQGSPVDYRFLEVNPAFETQTGLRNAQGRLMRDLAPDHEAQWFEIYGKIALTGQPARFVNEAKALNRWFDVSAFRFGGADSRKVAIVFNDITEHKHAEARMRLQAVALQSAANAIAITDRNGVIIWVNDAFTQLTGYSAAEAIGQNPRALKSGIHDSAFYKNMWATVLAGHVWHDTLVNKRKDGTLYTEEMTITPVSDSSGQITHFIAIKQDITERQRAEEQIRNLNTDLVERVRLRTLALQSTNQELEAFCYSVSHDLRAPLRGINGFSQALLDDYGDKLDPAATDFLLRINTGCQRMAQLIDDLLNLSRLSRAEMQRIPVSLSKLAGELAAELKESDPGRLVEVRIAGDVHAVGDPALLRAALSNLLGNAWKFTSKAAGASVEFGSSHSNGHSTYFVRDNGAGFDMAYADKLFQPFQRLHGMREFPGNGIGLATVGRIIRRHGGRVWAEAVPGQGATFFFTLEPEEGQHHG